MPFADGDLRFANCVLPITRYYRFVRKLFVPGLVALVVAFTLFFTGCSKPTVEVSSTSSTLGKATPIAGQVHASRGVKSVTATIEQEGHRYPAWQLAQPSKEKDTSFNFIAGTQTVSQLKDGPAKLIIDAKSNGPLGQSAQWEKDFTVVTRAPSESADSDTHYLYVGMADLATLNVTGSYTEAGVKLATRSSGHGRCPAVSPECSPCTRLHGTCRPIPCRWSMPRTRAGNDVTTPLKFEFPKKEQPRYTVHELQVDDRSCRRLSANWTRTVLATCRAIREDQHRDAQGQQQDALGPCEQDRRPLPVVAAVSSAGRKDRGDLRRSSQVHLSRPEIDEQTHLGYDLASTQHAGVIASNDGRVVFAAPLASTATAWSSIMATACRRSTDT